MRPLWDAAFKNTEAKNKGASGGPLALPPAPCALWHINPSSSVPSGFRKISDANCPIAEIFFGITEGRSGRGHHRACTSPWRAARKSQRRSQAQWRSWLKLLRHRPWKVSAVAVWPGQRWAAWLQLDKSLENAQQQAVSDPLLPHSTASLPLRKKQRGIVWAVWSLGFFFPPIV